jgi:hypothetical protein
MVVSSRFERLKTQGAPVKETHEQLNTLSLNALDFESMEKSF